MAQKSQLTRIDTEYGRYYQDQKGRQFPSVTTILDSVGDVVIEQSDTGAYVNQGLTGWAAGLAADYVLKHIDEGWTKTKFREQAREQPRIFYEWAGHIGSVAHDLLWVNSPFEYWDSIPPERQSQLAGVVTPEGLLATPEDIPVLKSVLKSWEAFKDDFDVSPVPLASEMYLKGNTPGVGGFGGTLDTVLRIGNGETVLLDAKCSIWEKDTHALQVAAYTIAYEQSGYPAPDHAWILHLPRWNSYKYYRQIVDLEPAKKAFRAAHRLYVSMRVPLYIGA